MTFRRASIGMLGYGSLIFGIWGLVSPRSLAEAAGDDPEIAPWLGLRDTAIGAALLTTGGAVALAARAASDISDAWRLRSRSPKIALGALGFALTAGVTLASVIAERRISRL